MNIQICILTGQPLANLIPILQFKPDRIAILVSDGMSKNLNSFLSTLETAGWSKHQIDCFEGMPDHDYEKVFEFVSEIGEKLSGQHLDTDLWVNLTGGNKLMTLGTFMALENHCLLYTDTAHQQIEFVNGNPSKVEPMASVLDLEISLKAAGLTLRKKQDQDDKWIQLAQQRKEATKLMGSKAEDLAGLISQFNYNYAGENQETYSSKNLHLNNPPKGPWLEALKTLEKAGVLQAGDNTSHWRPNMTDSARYLSGGWLEEYAWHCARDAGVPDNCLGISVVVTDDSNRKADIRNEGDVILVANNRLLLIECKTGNLSRDGKDQDTINKLSTLAEKTGGLMAEGLLVSSQPLERETKEKRKVNSRARAHAMDLKTLESGQLKTLRAEIQHWVEHGQWPKS